MKPLSVWRPLHWHNRCPLAAVVLLLNTTSPLRAAEVVAWGDNAYGQINVPAEATNVVAVAAGLHHSLALRADGTVVAWGWNVRRQTDVPLGLSHVVAVAGGGAHSLALRGDGTVVAWGRNEMGWPDGPQGLRDVTAIATAGVHALALRADGVVLAWGQYFDGSGTTPAFVPAGLSNVVAIAAAESYSVAVVCLRPTLEAVQMAPDWFLLHWDSAPEQMVLQQSVRLEPGEWTEVEALPNDRGGRRSISLRVLGGARFFRLRLR